MEAFQMKTLKNKSTVLLVLILAAALLLSACGTAAILASQDSDSTADLTSANSGSAVNYAALSAEGSQSSAQSVSSSDAFSEAFSNRDLSGDYDTAEAVTISLNGTSASASSDSVQISGGTVTITAAGTYILSGTLDNGSIIVNATKDDKIQLVLDGVTIRSETFAAIYVVQADKVFVTLAESSVNTLTNGGSFVQSDDNDVDAVIFAKDDITLNGAGKLVIASPAGHGIVGKDEVTVTGGTYEISSAKCAIRGKDSIAISDGSFTIKAGTDGLHAENNDDDTLGNIYIAGGSFVITAGDDAIHANTLLQIDGGEITVSAAEGLEATYVQINGGDISISASDDGVNAARKSSAYTPTFEMNDGTLTVVMGQGDTDGIDSNGNIIINGGTINVSGQSSFDYDGTAQYNGGTIIVNGQQVTTIPNQMMGGGMGGNGGMGGFGGRRR
jgi:hypothetical protein